ncbi:uncharacterized protein MONBRDRAFT_34009 [Monosiga brevicollis MX1]|uniref:Uncharacterized protein n=1 Tax=Monosiga brevicollis TaxID=81824 RepID=A9V927_MONBE|nr:uncharacterized protein MONBRDRAFT_34009 [Monosiga brevicollis MX1]EDQ85980.1 predicted protein [Monosiga brevicollis MX1]|eukprot:XP_001749174.1 hypothetical protein [Monosiga brevicollis MX1]
MWAFARQLLADIEAAAYSTDERQLHRLKAAFEDAVPEFYYLQSPKDKDRDGGASETLVFHTLPNSSDQQAVDQARTKPLAIFKARVEGAATTTILTDQQVANAHTLSGILGISQVTAAALLVEAEDITNHPLVFREASLLTRGAFLFYEAERMLFSILCILLEAVTKQSFSPNFNTLALELLESLQELPAIVLTAVLALHRSDFEARADAAQLLAHDRSAARLLQEVKDCWLEACDALLLFVTAARVVAQRQPSDSNVDTITTQECLILLKTLQQTLGDGPAGSALAPTNTHASHTTAALDGTRVFVAPTAVICLLHVFLRRRLHAVAALRTGDRTSDYNDPLANDLDFARALDDTTAWNNNPTWRLLMQLAFGLCRTALDKPEDVWEGVQQQATTLIDHRSDESVFECLHQLANAPQCGAEDKSSAISIDTLLAFCDWLIEDGGLLRMLMYNYTEAVASGSDVTHDDFVWLLKTIATVAQRADADMMAERVSVWDGFLRMVGDQLDATTYIVYLEVLAAFAKPGPASQYVFTLLMDNGREGFRQAPVSWRSLFAAIASATSMSHESGQAVDILTQQMLEAFLHLLATVCEDPECARGIVSRDDWHAIDTLFTFFCSHLETTLKGKLLAALAAICAAHPPAARVVWHLICASHVLVGDSTNMGNIQIRDLGVVHDLRKREAEAKTYPETFNFVRLLKAVLPHVVDEPQSRHSLRVAINYLISEVFLAALRSLQFISETERWELLADALTTLRELLSRYQPTEGDFGGAIPAGATPAEAFTNVAGSGLDMTADDEGEVQRFDDHRHVQGPRYVGFLVLASLLQDPTGNVLVGLGNILARSAPHEWVDKPVQLQEAVINCVTLTVQILEVAAGFSAALNDMHVKTHQRVDSFLMNQSRGDDVLSPLVVHLIMLLDAEHSAELALDAIKLVYRIAGTSHNNVSLRSIFNAAPALERQKMLFAFQYRLMAIGPELVSDQQDVYVDVLDEEHYSCDNAVASSVVQLLRYSLSEDGLWEITPLLLMIGVAARITKPRDVMQVQLLPSQAADAQSCLHVLIDLITNKSAANRLPLYQLHPLFAENCFALLYALQSHPVVGPMVVRFTRESSLARDLLEQLKGLLELSTFSTELDRRSAAWTSTMGWILKSIALELYVAAKEPSEEQRWLYKELFGLPQQSAVFSDTFVGDAAAQPVSLMRRVLNAIDFRLETVGQLNLSHLPLGIANQAFQACTKTQVTLGDEPIPYCFVREMHEQLLGMLERGGYDLGLREAYVDDITAAVNVALQTNLIAERRGARLHLLKGWERVLTIMFSKTAPLVTGDDQIAELGEQLMYLLTHLPVDLQMTQQLDPALMSVLSNNIVTLTANLQGSLQRMSGIEEAQSSALSVVRNLQEPLLASLVQGVLTAGCGPRMRQNHYCSLHFYITIARTAESSLPSDWIAGPSERFMDMVCRDACDGTGVTCILALLALSELVALDDKGNWLAFMARRGFLDQYVHEAQAAEEQLQALAFQSSSNFNPFYKHQARYALFLNCARSSSGAKALLESPLLLQLEHSKLLRAHNVSDDGSVGSSGASWSNVDPRSIVLPMLRVLDQMTMHAAGTDIHLGMARVFRANFTAYFRPVLKGWSALKTPNALDELMLVTSLVRKLIARAAKLDPECFDQEEVQRLIIPLLAYLMRADWKAAIHYNSREAFEQNEIMVLVQNTLFNILCFLRQSLDRDVEVGKRVHVALAARVFIKPSFVEDVADEITCGSALSLLKQLLATQQDAKKEQLNARSSEGSISMLGPDRLRRIGVAEDDAKNEQVVARALELMADTSEQIVRITQSSTECLLYMLWRHLDFYLNSQRAHQTSTFQPQRKIRTLEAGIVGAPLHHNSDMSDMREDPSLSAPHALTTEELKVFQDEVQKVSALRSNADSLLSKLVAREKELLVEQKFQHGVALTLIKPIERRIRSLVDGLNA